MNSVRLLREKLKLSRPEFAQLLDLSASRLTQFETELPDHVREKLREIAEEHGYLLLVREFSDASGPGEDQAKAAGEYPYPKTREWHELLEFVLQNDPKAADWITGNLKMFVEAIRSRQQQKPAKRGG